MMFEIDAWVAAGLHRDPESLAWMSEMAPPGEVVGPVELMAEGVVALRTMPSGGGELRRVRDFSHDRDCDGRFVGWITMRRVFRPSLPIPPPVAVLFSGSVGR